MSITKHADHHQDAQYEDPAPGRTLCGCHPGSSRNHWCRFPGGGFLSLSQPIVHYPGFGDNRLVFSGDTNGFIGLEVDGLIHGYRCRFTLGHFPLRLQRLKLFRL